MQTFIVDHNIQKSFMMLDVKRLGKQRVEAIQILQVLLGERDGWRHHPAVKMWKSYPTGLWMYARLCCDEWIKRGYRNEKCEEHLSRLWNKIVHNEVIPPTNSKIWFSSFKPPWISNEFIRAHQSNLIRKFPEYYVGLFPNIPNDIPYIWPNN